MSTHTKTSRTAGGPSTRQSISTNVAVDEDIRQDISKIKEQLENVVKKADLTALSAGLVKSKDIEKIVSSIVESMRKDLERDLGQKITEKTAQMRQELDLVNAHNHRLQESLQGKQREIDELKKQSTEMQREVERVQTSVFKEMEEVKRMAQDGIRKGNYNEQYSRRNNIKVMDFKEKENVDDENRRDLMKDFCDEVNKVISHPIHRDDLVTVHRIPGRDTKRDRPLVVKFVKKDVRNSVIKQRKNLMGTMKLVDDLTKDNAGLINRLKSNERIENAWYFNGRVFAVCDGVRKPVDLFQSVNDVFRGR
ncbi:uncharacterized protein LOC132552759 isoform X2 [Ylistrum balloti]|uniref:uncharacterized protein LOC132552759 isoform X2 n=1 Tax=Ylistrum balloti TaxID=509963 RepID=UPI002905DD8F|nr:uncharacterized protein LOC132552759 isoform X2 [Ylistrum balloti]